MSNRILIVEDEAIIAEDMREVLIKSGYEVIGITVSGQDALDKVYTSRPELVSMDIGLRGGMDGIEVAKLIKNNFNIPIIFMSSNTDHATITRAKAVSCWFLPKPFAEKDLIETTSKALREACP